MITRLLLIGMACLAALPVLAQESAASRGTDTPRVPTTPAEKVDAIKAEYDLAWADFQKLLAEAKTDEENEKLYETRRPKAETWFPRLFGIARDDGKGPGAEAALIWIVLHADDGPHFAAALKTLSRDHVASLGLKKAVQSVSHSRSLDAAEFLQELERASPHREVKGLALYGLAQQKRHLARTARAVLEADESERKEIEKRYTPELLARLRSLDLEKTDREAEAFLVRTKERYGDVVTSTRKLGDRVDGDLFEIRNLTPGKVAPEVEGEDIDGKPMKLSDFKGKVVVLDFWGHW